MDCRYKEKCRNYCGRCNEDTCNLALKEINKELQRKNTELKARLERTVELLKKFAISNIDDCDMCKNLYNSDLCDMCGKYGRSHFECKYQDEFEEVVEEAEQALKGGTNNE